MAWAGQSEEQSIGPTHVVRDEHGPARLGNVFHPFHPHPVKQPRQQPEGEAEGLHGEEAGTEQNHRQGDQAAEEEDLPGAEVQNFGEHPEYAPGQQHAREGDEVVGGQDGPPRLHRRAMLQEGLQGNVEKAGAKAQRQQRQATPEVAGRVERAAVGGDKIEQQAACGHAGGGPRDHPQLDLAGRPGAGQGAAQADAHCQRGQQVADGPLVHAQADRGQAIDVDLGGGGQEPIEGAGQGRQQQRAVGPQRGQVAPRLGDGVQREAAAGIGRSQRGDAQAGRQAQQGHADQGGGRDPPMLPALRPAQAEQRAARHGAADDRHNGRQPHQAVGRRESIGGRFREGCPAWPD